MRRDMATRFTIDGRDGWQAVSDIPASTSLARSIVARRIDEDLQAVRIARMAHDQRSRRSLTVRLATRFVGSPAGSRSASAGRATRTAA